MGTTKMDDNGMATPARSPGATGSGAKAGKASGGAGGASRAATPTADPGAGAGAGARARTPTAAPGAGGARRAAPAKSNGSDLRSDLREFAKGRPEGWNHEEWLGFIEQLRGKGHNINDHEAIGSMLERERIGVLLEKVPGLGAQRIRSLSEAFGNVWRLREADADEIARTAKLPRDVAQRVVDTLHQ